MSHDQSGQIAVEKHDALSETGRSHGVMMTPTIVVNGQRVVSGILLNLLLEGISAEFGEKISIEIHKGPVPRLEELKISALPAVVTEDLVRIMGLCPSRESLVAALRECGV